VRLPALAGLTQEQVAERSGVSVDVIRKLEQHRKHSARLPTLHALARGLGMEVTTLLGDPPAVAANGAPEPPELVELRRAVMPSLVPKPPGDLAAACRAGRGMRRCSDPSGRGSARVTDWRGSRFSRGARRGAKPG